MTVLNLTTHDAVTGIHDYVEKLKDFAVAQGWTQHDFLQNVQFQSGSGFIAGSESFLQISTTGHGSQSIFVRIRAEASGVDPLSETLTLGMHKTNTYSNSGSHPVAQGNWNGTTLSPGTSYSPTSIPMLWLFGNDKVIHTVAQHSNTQVVFQSFGSLELFDSTYTDGEFACRTSSTLQKWYNNAQTWPLDGGISVYVNGIEESNFFSSDVVLSYRATASTVTNGSYGHSANSLEGTNGFSERRILEKQMVSVIDTGDGLFFPLGQTWAYRAYSADLPIGQEISFGSKKFLVFPNANNASRSIGVAFRIA